MIRYFHCCTVRSISKLLARKEFFPQKATVFTQKLASKLLFRPRPTKLTGDIGERQCNLFRSGQGKRDKLMLIQVISSCKYLIHYFFIIFKSIYMVSMRYPFRTSILERQDIFNNSITRKIITQKIHRIIWDCDHFQKIKKIFIWFTGLMVSLNWPVVFWRSYISFVKEPRIIAMHFARIEQFSVVSQK